MKRVASLLFFVAALACKNDQAPEAEPIPEALRGVYAQKPEQLAGKTAGLQVEDKALRFTEFTVTVVEGKATSSGDYQVVLAEATWEKDPKIRKCSGTIGRQGTSLLVKLYEQDTEHPCDNVLTGEWRGLTEITEVPPPLQGTFGEADAEAANAGDGFVIAKNEITFIDDQARSDSRVELGRMFAWSDKPEEIVVSSAKHRGSEFLLRLAVADDKAAFELFENGTRSWGEESGVRWMIDASKLPKKTLTNDKVDVTFAGDRATIATRDEQGLRCELPILRTAERSASESARGGIPVTGGTIAVLGSGVPKAGAEGCVQRLANLAKRRCEEERGAECAPEEVQAYADLNEAICPRQIVVGDGLAGGRKLALLPQSTPVQACFDMTGEFE